MTKLKCKSEFKVGDSIQHNFCKIIKEVVFISKNNSYLLVESHDYPLVVTSEHFDLWVVVPKLYEKIDSSVLEKAYSVTSNLEDFLEKLEECQQDFLESSLP